MSYLDKLDRVTKSPATDFYQCIFYNPSQRDTVDEFFTNDVISDAWLQIRTLEQRLFFLEKDRAIPDDIKKHQRELPATDKIADEYDAWSNSYKIWQNYVKSYTAKFKVFQEKKLYSPNKRAKTVPDTNKNITHQTVKSDTNKMTGMQFLMSIAGMFDSGETDNSENVKEIVTNAILEKHGK